MMMSTCAKSGTFSRYSAATAQSKSTSRPYKRNIVQFSASSNCLSCLSACQTYYVFY